MTRAILSVTRILLLLLLPLLSVACDTPSADTPSAPHAPVTGPSQPPAVATASLTIGYAALRISLPVIVAQERGYFAKHGLTVELKRFETAQPMVEELVDGRLLAAGFAALPIVFTAAQQARARVHLVGAMIEDETHPVSYLLRREDDAQLQTLAQLQGKRIGVLPTLAYQKWLQSILTQAGVDVTSVSVVPLAPPMQSHALAEGGVDALFTGDPMATAALASAIAAPLGAAAPLPRALGGPVWFGSFLVHPKLVHERATDVTALIRALDEAIAYVMTHQAEARALLAPTTREAERAHVQRYPDALYKRSTEVDDLMLDGELSRMRSLGILASKPDSSGVTLRPAATP